MDIIYQTIWNVNDVSNVFILYVFSCANLKLIIKYKKVKFGFLSKCL